MRQLQEGDSGEGESARFARNPGFLEFVAFLRQLVDDAIQREFRQQQAFAALQVNRLRRARLQQQEWLDLRNQLIHSGLVMGLLALLSSGGGAWLLANSLPLELACAQPKAIACWLKLK